MNKNYGIESKKTFTSKFPEIPNVFIKHFIRGIFDGDGSITKISKYNYAVSITNNFDILNFISKHFYEILGIRIRNKTGYPKIVASRRVFLLTYTNKNLLIIMNYLYNDSSVYMDRKKEKFEEFKKWFEEKMFLKKVKK